MSVLGLSCSPEPHILLFRRPLGTDPQSGHVDPELLAAAREEYKNQFGLRKMHA
jgi:cyclin-dependent kinase regulatory subunit CKS1